MDPRGFLVLAKKLVDDEKSPAGRRTAVSRAYYAAFNVAAEFLAATGCTIAKDASGHEIVYQYLNNSGDDLLIQAGRHLHNLRRDRNEADYKLDKKHVEKEENARNVVDTADEVIKNLDDCTNGSAERRTAVTIAVKAYAKMAGRVTS